MLIARYAIMVYSAPYPEVDMSIRNFLADLFSRSHPALNPGMSVNPATGLPMLDGAIDVAGNPYGTRRHETEDDGGSPGCGGSSHHHDDHRPIGGFDHHSSGTSTDWSGTSWSGTSSGWPDHSSSSSGGYDPSRGW